MPRFEIKVQEQRGYCSRNYKVGDSWIVDGFDTPDKFCGGAYTTVFPIIVALSSGSEFSFEKDPLCKTNMACPDNGNVVFSVRKIVETD